MVNLTETLSPLLTPVAQPDRSNPAIHRQQLPFHYICKGPSHKLGSGRNNKRALVKNPPWLGTVSEHLFVIPSLERLGQENSWVRVGAEIHKEILGQQSKIEKPNQTWGLDCWPYRISHVAMKAGSSVNSGPARLNQVTNQDLSSHFGLDSRTEVSRPRLSGQAWVVINEVWLEHSCVSRGTIIYGHFLLYGQNWAENRLKST